LIVYSKYTINILLIR